MQIETSFKTSIPQRMIPIIPRHHLVPHRPPIHLADLHLLKPPDSRPPDHPSLRSIQSMFIAPSYQRIKINTFPIDGEIGPRPLLRLQPDHSRHGRVGAEHDELHIDLGAVPEMEAPELRVTALRLRATPIALGHVVRLTIEVVIPEGLLRD